MRGVTPEPVTMFGVTAPDMKMSTAPPPSGVGVYDTSVTLSLATDAAALQAAGWLAGVGTVDEARWPTISVDLAHPYFTADQALTRAVLAATVGDRVDVVNLPAWLPPFAVEQIITGRTVTFAAKPNDDRWSLQVAWEPINDCANN